MKDDMKTKWRRCRISFSSLVRWPFSSFGKAADIPAVMAYQSLRAAMKRTPRHGRWLAGLEAARRDERKSFQQFLTANTPLFGADDFRRRRRLELQNYNFTASRRPSHISLLAAAR